MLIRIALTSVMTALALVPSNADAKPPAPDGTYRIATYDFSGESSKRLLTIAQIDASGLKVLGKVQSAFSDLYWFDAQRLVATEHGEETIEVHQFMDGRPDGAALTIPIARFTVKRGESAPYSSKLTRDKKGGLWLEACLRWDEDLGVTCKSYGWLPLDLTAGKAGTMTRKTPAGVKKGHIGQRGLDPAKMPKLRAPEGFKVKLHRIDLVQENLMTTNGKNIRAFTCTSPQGTQTWPHSDIIDWEFKTQPKSATWVMQNPPLLWVQGPATNPIAITSPTSSFFLGCAKEAMEDVIILGPDVWMEAVTQLDGDRVVIGNHWIVYRGATKLGAVQGDRTPFASITR